MAEPKSFPLFKGATRVPTIAGVPMIPLIIMLMGSAMFAMYFSLWWWLCAPLAWGLMAQITRHDDRAFRIWWLWIDTTLRNRNQRFWGASSYNPADYRSRKSAS